MDRWVERAAAEIAARAEDELRALVAVSSPSGDVDGAEGVLALIAALLPAAAEVERPPCSSPDHARDLIARLRGTGTRRVLLLGHVDTVVAHGDHRPLTTDGDELRGSGAVDMKGGDVLALGVLRALADEPDRYAELTLLLVCDEEWRTAPFAHVERFAGYDACLCFEAGQRAADGGDEVIVERKAAGTLAIDAYGRSAHSGSAPDRGANALVALAEVTRIVAACHDPAGPDRLTAVPTVLRSGDAFNVVPASGRLTCDLRARSAEAFDRVLAAIPDEVAGVRLAPTMLRVWPGMDARAATAPVLERAAALLGRPLAGASRGGASDASHLAGVIAVTIDGLGPRGGGAHTPGEHVSRASLGARAEIALAVTGAILDA